MVRPPLIPRPIGRQTSMFRVSSVSEARFCACSGWRYTVSADSDAVGASNEE
jgi:hypothetical protein